MWKEKDRVYTLDSSPVKCATLVFLWKNLTGQAPVKSSTKIGGQVHHACFPNIELTSLGADAYLTDPRDPIETYL